MSDEKYNYGICMYGRKHIPFEGQILTSREWWCDRDDGWHLSINISIHTSGHWFHPLTSVTNTVFYIVKYKDDAIVTRAPNAINVNMCTIVKVVYKLNHAITYYELISNTEYDGPRQIIIDTPIYQNTTSENVNNTGINYAESSLYKQQSQDKSIQYNSKSDGIQIGTDQCLQISCSASIQSSRHESIQFSYANTQQFVGDNSIQISDNHGNQICGVQSVQRSGNNSTQRARQGSISIINGDSCHCQHIGRVLQILYVNNKYYTIDRIWDGELYEISVINDHVHVIKVEGS